MQMQSFIEFLFIITRFHFRSNQVNLMIGVDVLCIGSNVAQNHEDQNGFHPFSSKVQKAMKQSFVSSSYFFITQQITQVEDVIQIHCTFIYTFHECNACSIHTYARKVQIWIFTSKMVQNEPSSRKYECKHCIHEMYK